MEPGERAARTGARDVRPDLAVVRPDEPGDEPRHGRAVAGGRAVRCAGLEPGRAALDVCCGTGDLAIELRRAVGPGGRVVGLDFSEQMLEVARAKGGRSSGCRATRWGCRSPTASSPRPRSGGASATSPTASCGFREMARVVRPGGRVVCLEMSQPPRLGRAVRTSGPTAPCPCWARCWRATATPTRYLPESARAFPGAPQLAAIMRDAGLTTVGYRRPDAGRRRHPRRGGAAVSLLAPSHCRLRRAGRGAAARGRRRPRRHAWPTPAAGRSSPAASGCGRCWCTCRRRRPRATARAW